MGTETIDYEKEILKLTSYRIGGKRIRQDYMEKDLAFACWMLNEGNVSIEQDYSLYDIVNDVRGESYGASKDIWTLGIIDGEYLIYTNEEAETAWDDSINDHIDNIIVSEMSGYERYFDENKFKDDAHENGRADLISCDSIEHEIKFNNTRYYIYRTS